MEQEKFLKWLGEYVCHRGRVTIAQEKNRLGIALTIPFDRAYKAQWFTNIMGMGRYRTNRIPRKGYIKYMYKWCISSQDDIRRFVATVQPYLPQDSIKAKIILLVGMMIQEAPGKAGVRLTREKKEIRARYLRKIEELKRMMVE